ncbi:hypothetical protein Bbelb_353570 [Branchiostoma belcheri]|nr:hypothetical protein Bbelb_353570 [Branchiostoma belcheri]
MTTRVHTMYLLGACPCCPTREPVTSRLPFRTAIKTSQPAALQPISVTGATTNIINIPHTGRLARRKRVLQGNHAQMQVMLRTGGVRRGPGEFIIQNRCRAETDRQTGVQENNHRCNTPKTVQVIPCPGAIAVCSLCFRFRSPLGRDLGTNLHVPKLQADVGAGSEKAGVKWSISHRPRHACLTRGRVARGDQRMSSGRYLVIPLSVAGGSSRANHREICAPNDVQKCLGDTPWHSGFPPAILTWAHPGEKNPARPLGLIPLNPPSCARLPLETTSSPTASFYEHFQPASTGPWAPRGDGRRRLIYLIDHLAADLSCALLDPVQKTWSVFARSLLHAAVGKQCQVGDRPAVEPAHTNGRLPIRSPAGLPTGPKSRGKYKCFKRSGASETLSSLHCARAPSLGKLSASLDVGKTPPGVGKGQVVRPQESAVWTGLRELPSRRTVGDRPISHHPAAEHGPAAVRWNVEWN